MEKLNGGTLTPAPYRDYKSRKAAVDDFLSGKDFVLHHYTGRSALCSIRDFAPGSSVILRYKNFTLAVVIQIPKEEEDE